MSSLSVTLWLILILTTWDRAWSLAPPGSEYLGTIGCNQTKAHSIAVGATYSYEFTDELSTITAINAFTFHTCGTTTYLDLELEILYLDGDREVWIEFGICDAQNAESGTACAGCSGMPPLVHEQWTVPAVRMPSDKRIWITIKALTSQSKDIAKYLLTMECTYNTAIPTTMHPTTTTPTTMQPTTSIPTIITSNASDIGTSISIGITNIGSTGNPDRSGGTLQIIVVICLCILCSLIVFCVLNKRKKEPNDDTSYSAINMKGDQNSEPGNDEVIIAINKTHTLDPKAEIFKMEGEKSYIEDNELPELPPMKTNDSLYGPGDTTDGMYAD
eukprot:457783_1